MSAGSESLFSARFGRTLCRRFRRKPERGLTYASTARCKCGAGLAYRHGDTAWDCSDILLGVAIPMGEPGSVQHSDKFPFVFYEIKGENQPSAEGATTRERVPAPKPEWVLRGKRNTEIVRRATGIDGHAIRCGWAVLEQPGLHADWTQEGADTLVGARFRWLNWTNEGAIVAAVPQGQNVRVEVWAIPA